MQTVAALSVAITFALALAFFNFGRWFARRGRAAGMTAVAVAWGLLLLDLGKRLVPQYEDALLVLPAYAVFRDVLFFPLLALLIGAAGELTDARKRRTMHVLLIVFTLLTAWQFRWGMRTSRDVPPAANRDTLHILRARSAETSAAAAGATLVTYYGVMMSGDDMARFMFSRPGQGPTVIGICEGLRTALRGTGCDVNLRSCTVAEARDLPRPSLLLLDPAAGLGEAAVLYRAHAEGALLGSPSHGLVWVEAQRLAGAWTGLVVEVRSPFWFEPELRRPATAMLRRGKECHVSAANREHAPPMSGFEKLRKRDAKGS